MRPSWLEINEAFIKAQWQPSVLLDLLLSDYSSHKLLKGSGLFYEDIINGEKQISASAFFTIIQNCKLHYSGDDLAFRVGQRLFPGHYDAISSTLNAASSFFELATAICHFSDCLTPGLSAKFELSSDQAVFRWIGSFGHSAQLQFLVEAYTTALKSYCHTRSGEKWPWRFEFSYDQPKSRQLYEMYLDQDCRFSRPQSRLCIPTEFVHRQWPNESRLLYARGIKNTPTKHGFARVVYDYLEDNIQEDCSQESLAIRLGLSLATLKRKLKSHHCTYREIVDHVRLAKAISLYQEFGFSNEQVAKALGFFDEANLRRSFKRWTGMNPGQYLKQLEV
jgi:AraC-like DNA-binding protein